MLRTPGGRPAAAKASAIRYEDSGVSGAVFTTTVHPANNAGTAFIRICMTGPFHGTTPATTPTGLWRMMAGPEPPGRPGRTSSTW